MAKRSQTERDDNRALKTIEVVNTLKESLGLYAEFVKAAQKHTAMVNAAVLSGKGVTEVLSRIADQTGGDLGEAMKAIAETQNAMLDRQIELVSTMTDNLITAYIDKENGRLNNDKQDLLNFAKNYKAKRFGFSSSFFLLPSSFFLLPSSFFFFFFFFSSIFFFSLLSSIFYLLSSSLSRQSSKNSPRLFHHRANSLKTLKKAESKAAAANKPKAKAKKPDQAVATTQALEDATKKHDSMLTESMLEVVQLHR